MLKRKKAFQAEKTASAMAWKYGRYTVRSGLSYSLMWLQRREKKERGMGNDVVQRTLTVKLRNLSLNEEFLEFYFKKSDLHFKKSL